jgi:hypothetical protein
VEVAILEEIANLERRGVFPIFKLLLEVFPVDSQQTFSTAVVWGVAPEAKFQFYQTMIKL